MFRKQLVSSLSLLCHFLVTSFIFLDKGKAFIA